MGTTGEPQWQIRREEVDRGILAVLGVYDGEEKKERIVKWIKKNFFVHTWLNTRENLGVKLGDMFLLCFESSRPTKQ